MTQPIADNKTKDGRAQNRRIKTVLKGVYQGETAIMKAGVKKVQKIYKEQVLVGFAGGVADAFSLRCWQDAGFLRVFLRLSSPP